MQKIHFRNLNKINYFKTFSARLLLSNFYGKKKIGYYLNIANEVLKYQEFIHAQFQETQIRITREKIWKDFFDLNSSPTTVFEFGVAHGYATNYLLHNYKQIAKYHAFDTFVGLPESWRNYDAGKFSNLGMLPNISDDRLTFHVGLVQEVLSKNIKYSDTVNNLIFFDLDLFEPTLFAYNFLKDIGIIRPGSWLYLDEAFDADELTLLKDYIMKDFDVTCVSYSWSSIGLEIISPRISE